MLFEQLSAIRTGDELKGPLEPALTIWLACRKYGQKSISMSGEVVITPILPGPGSYLDQDAELMLAFDLLEEIDHELDTYEQARRQLIDQVQQGPPNR